MKKLLKQCKYGGLAGRKARQKRNITFGVLAFMAIIMTVCFISGSFFGSGMGVIMATGIAAFSIPEGVNLSEGEKKGLEAIAGHFNKQFAAFVNDKLSEEKMLEKMSTTLEKYCKEAGIDKETFEKWNKSLEEQGVALSKIKEQIKSEKENLNGLKSAFEENYDKLKDAIKNQKENFRIKADPDVIDQSLIETTAVITTSTGASLYENAAQSTDLFLKRRDRQYIEDIADVSVVAQVPEVFLFDEEGDEEGNIAIVTENGLKPQIQLKLIKNQVKAQKAAGFIVVTEELMKWRTRAWAAIQRLFRDKVMRDYENLLTTSLDSYATQYIGTPLDGTITAPNNIDAIIAGIAQLESLNFTPDVLVLNPVDKWSTAMTKDTNGMYVLPFISQNGDFNLVGLRIITSNKRPVGTFELAESGLWKVERENPSLRTGLVNDDFIHNRMTIVGEIFFLSYVPSNNLGGVMIGNFNDIKEALNAA